MSFSATSTLPAPRFQTDRLGVVLSVLCAIHCAITPIFLIFLPTFGKIWSHPASHWGMALIVVPIAVWMITAGYRRHRRRWIVLTGVAGVGFVLFGAAIPYLPIGESSDLAPAAPAQMKAGAGETEAARASEVFVWKAGEPMPGGETGTGEESEVFVWKAGEPMPGAECPDLCCPSFITDANGEKRLHIPLASIITTLGGLALIVTHLGNLCCCPGCKDDRL
ncbi:MAG: MerC domain-containing protein [Verrucomicrobiota bacterium]